MPEPVHQLVGHLFRHEAGRMSAVLARMLGLQDLHIAEDIVQDTLLKALQVWKLKGIPDNPAAWLYTVAKRSAIDTIRQRNSHTQIEQKLARAFQSEWTLGTAVQQLFLEEEIEDSQLRMMFACCHPAIPDESQIALILKTLCGLSIAEIAHSFLSSEDTISKRLYRAREKIRAEGIDLELLPAESLQPRLGTVLHTLYLLFSEGYHSAHPDALIRHDLCAEAMRLCLLLSRHQRTALPDTFALLALMCFQASRAEARTDAHGQVILLQYQDRSRWNPGLIEKGRRYLNEASVGEVASEYHLEAAIAACHAAAPSFEQTNWERIVMFYQMLSELRRDPFVELNRAIALGYARSARAGLEALETIRGLESHSIYQAALGDCHSRLGELTAARDAYEKAMTLSRSASERELLEGKIAGLA